MNLSPVQIWSMLFVGVCYVLIGLSLKKKGGIGPTLQEAINAILGSQLLIKSVHLIILCSSSDKSLDCLKGRHDLTLVVGAICSVWIACTTMYSCFKKLSYS